MCQAGPGWGGGGGGGGEDGAGTCHGQLGGGEERPDAGPVQVQGHHHQGQLFDTDVFWFEIGGMRGRGVDA